MCHFILNTERTTREVSHRATAVGGPEVVHVEQVKACLPLFRDGVSEKVGGKVNKGEKQVGALFGTFSRLEFLKGASQGSLTSLHQRDIVEIPACMMTHL